MTKYDQYVSRKIAEYGDRFDAGDLAPNFVRWFNEGARIRVRTDNYVRTGTVGVTTGWRPTFILMHRSSDHGSWDVLSTSDAVIAVQRGGRYLPL